jgi:hypothetical protein
MKCPVPAAWPRARRFSLAAYVATAVVMFAAAAPQAAADERITPPDVPGNLVVQDGSTPYLIGHASGTQNYSCLPSGTGVAWILYGPQATLFDGDEDQITTHFLSPNPAENGTPRATWQHSRDTSSVWAVKVAESTDAAYVAPGAIPWFLLDAVGTQYGPNWGQKLVRTTHIQRVNTGGGVAPATGCTVTSDIGKKALVPYTADYVFYRNKQ